MSCHQVAIELLLSEFFFQTQTDEDQVREALSKAHFLLGKVRAVGAVAAEVAAIHGTPPYIEQQAPGSLLCGVHAVNHVFKGRVVDWDSAQSLYRDGVLNAHEFLQQQADCSKHDVLIPSSIAGCSGCGKNPGEKAPGSGGNQEMVQKLKRYYGTDWCDVCIRHDRCKPRTKPAPDLISDAIGEPVVHPCKCAREHVYMLVHMASAAYHRTPPHTTALLPHTTAHHRTAITTWAITICAITIHAITIQAIAVYRWRPACRTSDCNFGAARCQAGGLDPKQSNRLV